MGIISDVIFKKKKGDIDDTNDKLKQGLIKAQIREATAAAEDFVALVKSNPKPHRGRCTFTDPRAYFFIESEITKTKDEEINELDLDPAVLPEDGEKFVTLFKSKYPEIVGEGSQIFSESFTSFLGREDVENTELGAYLVSKDIVGGTNGVRIYEINYRNNIVYPLKDVGYVGISIKSVFD
ncbi:hypothetical protein GQ42DRAFT_162431 [Ramicandelaber brevisporus]|nr:hypothetical protein GQ42DRAFT_162431 [Ramicandelaber brevisporus]